MYLSMERNRLLLRINRMCCLEKINSKIFLSFVLFDVPASTLQLRHQITQCVRLGGAFAPGNIFDLENSLE